MAATCCSSVVYISTVFPVHYPAVFRLKIIVSVIARKQRLQSIINRSTQPKFQTVAAQIAFDLFENKEKARSLQV